MDCFHLSYGVISFTSAKVCHTGDFIYFTHLVVGENQQSDIEFKSGTASKTSQVIKNWAYIQYSFVTHVGLVYPSSHPVSVKRRCLVDE